MIKFWHLTKYNLIFNKVKIAFLSILAIFILSITSYFYETEKELGEALIQYSCYIIFIIFTGKMNARTSMMFDIKHIMAFPLTNKEIIYLKSFTDAFQMFPMALLLLYGVSLALPEYHLLAVAIILYLLFVLGNMISFNKRIDFARMQHSKTSFKNSILFLHKYLEMFFQLILIIIGLAVIFLIFENNIFMQEYSLIVLLVTSVILTANKTLNMLVDETRSYFIFKRDSKRIGWKMAFVILPLLLFDQAYKGSDLIKKLPNQEKTIAKNILKKVKSIKNTTDQRALIAILKQDEEGLEQYLVEGNTIPWGSEIMGSYPTHLAAASGNKKILNKLLELNPESINKLGKFKKSTPIFSALRYCKMETVELLLQKGANLNHQDIDGNTPITYAAGRGCYGGVILLKQAGVKLDIKNLEGYYVTDYLKESTGLSYLFKDFLKEKQKSEQESLTRGFASEKRKSP